MNNQAGTPRTLQGRRKRRTARINAYARAHPSPRTVVLHGQTLRLDPGVFPSDIGEGTRLLVEALPRDLNGVRVWDLGTGCGVLAIAAAKRGARVVATDILPGACVCARHNADQNGVGDQLDIRGGDLFGALDKRDRFDLILFNAPFMPGTPITAVDVALHDFRHRSLSRFMRGAAERLNAGGRVLLAFTDLGNERLLQAALQRSNWSSRRVADLTSDEGDFYVVELRQEPG